MKNADMPAMPQTGHSNTMGDTYVSEDNGGSGFTKREEVASRNLAALLSAGLPMEHRTISEAIRAADMLFVELEKTR